MSVINSVPLIASGDDGYNISRSVRLRSSASAYFNRTLSSGNRKTWTWSGWVKRGSLSSTQWLFDADNGSTDSTEFNFAIGSGDTLIVAGSLTTWRVTTQVFRDPSAWYHIVLAVDTSQATANNRIRLYVNGSEVTAFSTLNNPTLNLDLAVNQAIAHYIGIRTGLTSPLNGYLTEVNFIDGQQLTPSSFGETDVLTGVWKPKKYGGTYGTNGFYLNFSDNSNNTATTIGKDYSGNGNNWTPNNISVTSGVTYDSMLDVPTQWADGGNGRGNYCVMNPLNTYAVTPTNGNLTASGSNAGFRGTMAIPSSGKWYWEVVATTLATQAKYVGIGQNNSLATGVRYEHDNGQKVVDGTNSAYGATWTANDVIGVAVDVDAGTITFYKNNTSQGSISYTFLTTDVYVPIATGGGTAGSDVVQANFGQRPFAYTPPTGFKALNTQNLPAGSITTSGSFTGNASSDGPFVYLNGVPTAMTINGNAVTFVTHVDKTANGFKVRSSSSSYNASGSNTYSITTTGAKFKYANAQVNP